MFVFKTNKLFKKTIALSICNLNLKFVTKLNILMFYNLNLKFVAKLNILMFFSIVFLQFVFTQYNIHCVLTFTIKNLDVNVNPYCLQDQKSLNKLLLILQDRYAGWRAL